MVPEIIHTTPHGRSLEIPRGRGDLKAKLLEGQYEAKLEFPGGVPGCKTKNLPWGEYGYFQELHNFSGPFSRRGHFGTF